MAKSKNNKKLSFFSKFSKQQLIIAAIFVIGFGGFGVWKLAFSSAAIDRTVWLQVSRYEEVAANSAPGTNTNDCMRLQTICHHNGKLVPVVDPNTNGSAWESDPNSNNRNMTWFGPYDTISLENGQSGPTAFTGKAKACFNLKDVSENSAKIYYDINKIYYDSTGNAHNVKITDTTTTLLIGYKNRFSQLCKVFDIQQEEIQNTLCYEDESRRFMMFGEKDGAINKCNNQRTLMSNPFEMRMKVISGKVQIDRVDVYWEQEGASSDPCKNIYDGFAYPATQIPCNGNIILAPIE